MWNISLIFFLFISSLNNHHSFGYVWLQQIELHSMYSHYEKGKMRAIAISVTIHELWLLFHREKRKKKEKEHRVCTTNSLVFLLSSSTVFISPMCLFDLDLIVFCTIEIAATACHCCLLHLAPFPPLALSLPFIFEILISNTHTPIVAKRVSVCVRHCHTVRSMLVVYRWKRKDTVIDSFSSM